MARKKKEVESQESLELKLEQQRQEIARLKAEKDKALESFLSTTSKGMSYELEQLRKKTIVGSRVITVKETADHKNITLWAPWGRKFGPLHPDNAEWALKAWWAMNHVQLTTTQPTAEQIQAYNDSPEGQERIKKEKASRALKSKSLKKDEITRLAKLIAESVGGNMDRLKYAEAK